MRRFMLMLVVVIGLATPMVASSSVYQWGLPGDVSVKVDWDRDGVVDLVVFRPNTGVWYVLYSNTGFTVGAPIFDNFPWGMGGDVPIIEDFDGDGVLDLAVWRPSNGTWFILPFGFHYCFPCAVQFGLPGDVPYVGDYNGDGRVDLAVFRPSTGQWFINWGFNYSGSYTGWDGVVQIYG